MKVAIVSSTLLRQTKSWHVQEFLCGIGPVDREIERCEAVIMSYQTRIKNLKKDRKDLLKRRAKLVASGLLKEWP